MAAQHFTAPRYEPIPLDEAFDENRLLSETSSCTIKDDAGSPRGPGDGDGDGIDPRLRDYPIPVVASTVDLENDDTEPLLTFRFWVLATFWVVVGCTISTLYYFKPYAFGMSGYAVQILSWGMGSLMAKYLKGYHINIFGRTRSLNPGPWSAKEHALVVIAYWGSSYTAYGLGPLSALELYYGQRLNMQWGVLFLMTTQLLGYGFAGLYRKILVRPTHLYYPGVLPNVALFNALHRAPSAQSTSLQFFGMIATASTIYHLFPSFIWPMLASLPLLCYAVPGDWKTFLLGSGIRGFGLFDISLDWNYASFFSPLYTPLWANMNRILGAVFAAWLLYPALYFSNTLSAMTFAPMSSKTWDAHGTIYNVSAILTADHELNRTAMAAYSRPYWSLSYASHYLWGFASSVSVVVLALLYHGRHIYESIFVTQNEDDRDPYLRLTAHKPSVPLSWYLLLLMLCLASSVIQLFGGGMQLPVWGLFLVIAASALFVIPSGILMGVANMQIGMDYLSELLTGALFPGKPIAVLTGTVYGRQVLEQCLNMVGDMKLAIYMKIPERPLFVSQLYGTVIGTLVNWICMRIVIDQKEPMLTGEVQSSNWDALRTRNFYSTSVMWGLLGPTELFGRDSPYKWVTYGFPLGVLAAIFVWTVDRLKPSWNTGKIINPAIFFNGAAIFPIYPTTNLMTSAIISFIFLGYVQRCHIEWFSKHNYLLGAGLDSGAQLIQLALVFIVDLAKIRMPVWWGNDDGAIDRCFPPSALPKNALN